ncbi:hypothetical protein MWU59_13250 [Flavobacteriaceae bacterium F08102]|nr:hypothetical protein [Flavobacteriaceae bacterium F08102]
MNLSGLRRKTTAHYYEKLLKKVDGKNREMPRAILRVGVLADSRLFGSYDISRSLSQIFDMPNNRIDILIFENLKDDYVKQHFNTFTEKDFGMYGKIKVPNVTDFIEHRFDILINYCNEKSMYTNLVALKSRAKFKIGFADSDLQKIYDFMVAVDGNKIDIFNEELCKYLKILKLIE